MKIKLIKARQTALNKDQWPRWRALKSETLDQTWYRLLTQHGGVHAERTAELLSSLEANVVFFLEQYEETLKTVLTVYSKNEHLFQKSLEHQ